LTETREPFELVTHTVTTVGWTTIFGRLTVIVGSPLTTTCFVTGPWTTTLDGQGVPRRMKRRRHGLRWIVGPQGGPIRRPMCGRRETMTDDRRKWWAPAVAPDSSLNTPVKTTPITMIEIILCRLIVLPFH
jgi:hypothetical protein